MRDYFMKIYALTAGNILVAMLAAIGFAKANIVPDKVMLMIALLSLLGINWGINASLKKSPMIALMWLGGFDVVIGFVLSVTMVVVPATIIMSAFISASSIFVIMSVLGFVTKIDLTRLGTLMLVALLAVIVAGIVNIFIVSSALAMVLSVVTIVIFTIMTAVDTQQFKNAYNDAEPNETVLSLAIDASMTLFLDWLNLFTSLIDLFSNDD